MNGTNGCFIDAHYLGASTIGALAARPHDAAVQHARHAYVLHVDVFGADFVRDVVPSDWCANQLVLARRFDRRGPGHRQVESLIADKLAVCDRAVHVAYNGYHALRD